MKEPLKITSVEKGEDKSCVVICFSKEPSEETVRVLKEALTSGTTEAMMFYAERSYHLQQDVDSLSRAADLRLEFLAQCKRDAGYDQSVSFDTVWMQVLAKSKRFDEQTYGRDVHGKE